MELGHHGYCCHDTLQEPALLQLLVPSLIFNNGLTGHCQKRWTLPMLCTERGRERTGDLRDGQRASGGSGNGLGRR